MSAPINDGGPAFPHLHNTCQRVNESEMFPGMTLRDYFAAQALTGLLANPDGGSSIGEVARCAYRYADAMLAARDGAK